LKELEQLPWLRGAKKILFVKSGSVYEFCHIFDFGAEIMVWLPFQGVKACQCRFVLQTKGQLQGLD